MFPPRQRGRARAPADVPLGVTQAVDLSELTVPPALFADLNQEEPRKTSVDFVRYRCRAPDSIKRSARDAMEYFMGEIRKAEKKGSADHRPS